MTDLVIFTTYLGSTPPSHSLSYERETKTKDTWIEVQKFDSDLKKKKIEKDGKGGTEYLHIGVRLIPVNLHP